MAIGNIKGKNLPDALRCVLKKLFSGLPFLLLLFASTTLAQGTIGRVYKLQGTWYQQGQSRPLVLGDRVVAGSAIRVQSPSRLDFILILLTNGQPFEKRCGIQDCSQTFQLPAVAEQSSFWTYIIEPVVNMFRTDPPRYSVAMPKAGDVVLREAIVEVKNGTANLAAVFEKVPRGTYSIRLERKAPGGMPPRAKHGKPVTIHWNQEAQSDVSFSGLSPGIYEVRLFQERDKNLYLPTPVTAWVLLSKPNFFKQTLSSFRNAIQMTDAWTGMSDDSVRAFLRAYLDHLLLQQGKDK